MSRFTLALGSAAVAVAALVTIPAAGAGAGSTGGCVAQASMPTRVALGVHPVVLRTTLVGTAACTGVQTDNGASATLVGPGGTTTNYPMRWGRIGGQDTATFYLGLTQLGTYRITGGDLQTYDARYLHIAYTWTPTATTVKYVGRFAGVARSSSTLSATLQYYSASGWHRHARIAVVLQRQAAGSTTWTSVATTHSSSSGGVAFHVGSGRYRLVSATSTNVWSTNHLVSSASSA